MKKLLLFTLLPLLVSGQVISTGNHRKVFSVTCTTCILDSISTTPEAAYALRKLRAAYAGNAMTVRRSSDGTTSAIGFTATGTLDTTTLLSFCAATNCYVTAWYDQSGNGQDAVQTTTAQQPQVVSSGSLITFQSLPTIQTSTSQLCIVGCTTNTTFKMGYTNAVLQLTTLTNYPVIFGQAPTSSGSEQRMRFNSSLTEPETYSLCCNHVFGSTSSLSTPYIYSFDWLAHLYINGVNQGSNPGWTQGGTVGQAALFSDPGGTPGEYLVGYISEFFIFSTAIADQTTLQHNQEAYFSISGS